MPAKGWEVKSPPMGSFQRSPCYKLQARLSVLHRWFGSTQDLQNILCDTSPEACQPAVADVLQLLRLAATIWSKRYPKLRVASSNQGGSEYRPKQYLSISFLSERPIRGGRGGDSTSVAKSFELLNGSPQEESEMRCGLFSWELSWHLTSKNLGSGMTEFRAVGLQRDMRRVGRGLERHELRICNVMSS